MPTVADWMGVAVAATRPTEMLGLARSLLRGSVRPGALSVVYQGSRSEFDALEADLLELGEEHDYPHIRVHHDAGVGASRARNLAHERLPTATQWVWTPNDTSRPPDGWLESADVSRYCDRTVGAFAMSYAVDGVLRRSVEPVAEIDGWALWVAIEPAIVWNLQAVRTVGGFDEQIGTGSPGMAQSGEATDLLARLVRAGWRVRPSPGTVEGRSQSHALDRRDALRKEFYYSVGFGCVARRHFALWRSLIAVVTPIVRFVQRRPYEGDPIRYDTVLAACSGRLVGLVVGEAATRPRRSFRRPSGPLTR